MYYLCIIDDYVLWHINVTEIFEFLINSEADTMTWEARQIMKSNRKQNISWKKVIIQKKVCEEKSQHSKKKLILKTQGFGKSSLMG